MPTLTHNSAQYPAGLVLAEAKRLGTPIAFCVCDAFGRPVVTGNTGVAETYGRLAVAKAKTALAHQMDTVNFRHRYNDAGGKWEKVADNWDAFDITHTAQFDPNFCGFAGGVLLIADPNDTMGSLGVSALTELEDHDIASKAAKSWRIAGA